MCLLPIHIHMCDVLHMNAQLCWNLYQQFQQFLQSDGSALLVYATTTLVGGGSYLPSTGGIPSVAQSACGQHSHSLQTPTTEGEI